MAEAAAQTQSAARDIEHFEAQWKRLRSEIGKVMVGQDDIVEGVLTCLLAGGHVLLEGVPGLGKTILVRTLAQVVHLDFGRIQFTPDLMPADIIGTNLIVEDADGSKRFDFQRGPLFTNILLADEVNRATPKTQSALLQAMAERHVTVGTNAYELPKIYFVLATQNPLEQEGTYPLPEAQLDRFLYKLNVPFPTLDELDEIMNRTITGHEPTIEPVADGEALLRLREIARRVPIASHIQRYALQVLQHSHPQVPGAPESIKRYVKAGGSPRGGQAMLAAARVHALLRGATAVRFEDIEAVTRPALRHRMLLNFEGEAEGVDIDELLGDILKSTKR